MSSRQNAKTPARTYHEQPNTAASHQRYETPPQQQQSDGLGIFGGEPLQYGNQAFRFGASQRQQRTAAGSAGHNLQGILAHYLLSPKQQSVPWIQRQQQKRLISTTNAMGLRVTNSPDAAKIRRRIAASAPFGFCPSGDDCVLMPRGGGRRLDGCRLCFEGVVEGSVQQLALSK